MGTDGEGAPETKPAEPVGEGNIDVLKMKVRFQTYAILLQLLVVISATIVPLLTILILILMDYFISPIPTATFSPIGLQVGGEGIEVTRLVIASLVGISAKRIYQLNTNSYPKVTIQETGDASD